jgi:beta-carotene ketolase (CrtW type)
MAAASLPGLTIALVVIGAWAGSLALGLASDLSLSTWGGVANVAAFVALRTLLYVGLFITAHDAMHGTVAPGHRRVNNAVGALALLLYAWLPFRYLREHHIEHHAAPARDGDPDWCADQRYLPWLAAFVRRYVNGWVIARNALFVTTLVALGASPLDAFALHVLPAWLSVVQLFTFGTWLPHRAHRAHGADGTHGPDGAHGTHGAHGAHGPDAAHATHGAHGAHGPGGEDGAHGAHGGALDDVHRARSANVSPLVSFVSCYHFGYHLEHHRAPHVPWWRLPAQRAAQRTAAHAAHAAHATHATHAAHAAHTTHAAHATHATHAARMAALP